MKKIVLALVLAVLLTGCTGKPSVPDGTGANAPSTPPEMTTAVPTTPAPTQPESSLLSSGIPVEGQGQLLYLPGTAVEEFDYAELLPLGNGALIRYIYYDEAGENGVQELVSIRLSDGEILGRMTQNDCGNAPVTTQGEYVLQMDHDRQVLSVYNANLERIDSHPVDIEWSEWRVSPDLEKMYWVKWQEGIMVTELATGKSWQAIPGTTQSSVLSEDDGRLLIDYVDVDTQRTNTAFLDMQTGELTPAELDANVGWVYWEGENFLIQDQVDYQIMHLLTPESHDVVTVFHGNLMQMDRTGHLLRERENRLELYDSRGKFLSSVALPEDEVADNFNGLVWWEDFGGYLLVSQSMEGNSKLYFWDLKQEIQGEDLPLRPYVNARPEGYATAPELYKRAEEMSAQYGVDIRIADQCQLDYDDFYGYAITEPQVISDALDALEAALSSYPQGYFQQLLYGRLESIRIELIGGLQKKNMPADAAFTSFAAFAQEVGDYYLVVADVYSTYEESYYHEFYHITDKRLEWDAQIRADALYSEENWMSLQPEGFSFSYSYDQLPDRVQSNYYYGWFVDDYSCTFPTEDRARIMEYAMMGWYLDTPVLTKLDFYSQCIRDCFDDTGWPEVTFWEKPLHE